MMGRKKILFVVASIYQLFNAINITKQCTIESQTDVILLKFDNNFVSNVNIDFLNNVFNKVDIITYKTSSNKLYKLINCIKNIWFNNFIKVNIESKYDIVFLSGTEIYSKIVSEKLRKKDGIFLYYEDGLASYYSVLNKETKKYKDLLLKMRYRHYNLDLCKGIYVYEPNCVQNNTNNIPCYQIHKIDRMSGINYKSFFFDAPFILQRKFVFLNAWFESKEEYELQEYLCSVLIDIVGKENVCIKTHPNESKKINRINGVEYIDSKCSFEISNYYENWSKQIFVSIISTASISPNLVYGDTPNVIFLYKIFQERFDSWKNIDKTVDLMKEMYGVSDNVKCPYNLKDYRNTLKFLL